MTTHDYFKNLPQKRMGVGALFFNEKGELLILKPMYKNGWTIPGGVVDTNESPRTALLREIKEELGIDVANVSFLAVDYMSPHESQYPTKDENLQFIFYGGTLRKNDTHNIMLPPDELSEWRFAPIKEALTLIGGNLARRIPACVEALKNNTAYYLEAGTRS